MNKSFANRFVMKISYREKTMNRQLLEYLVIQKPKCKLCGETLKEINNNGAECMQCKILYKF